MLMKSANRDSPTSLRVTLPRPLHLPLASLRLSRAASEALLPPPPTVNLLVLCGVVLLCVSTLDIGKLLLQRFALADVHGVQDLQSRQTEILFETMKAVEKMLSYPTPRIGEHSEVQLLRLP